MATVVSDVGTTVVGPATPSTPVGQDAICIVVDVACSGSDSMCIAFDLACGVTPAPATPASGIII